MIRITRVLRFVLTVVLPASAFIPTDATAQQPQRRDSAGISIVTYAPEQLNALPRRTADPTPVFSIGAVDGPPGTILDGVRFALSRRDGGVILADNRGTVIRRYDSTGRYLGSTGREGEGPGEFRLISGLSWLPGDSLAVYERFTRRVTVLDPELRFVRTLTLPNPISFDGGLSSCCSMGIYGLGGPDAVALAARPEDIVRPMGPNQPPPDSVVGRETARLLLLRPTPTPTPAIQLMLVPGMTRQRYGSASSNVQFGADPFLGGNQTGFFYADGARLEVLRFHPDGRLRWIFRVTGQPREVSASERQAVQTSIERMRATRPSNLPPRPAIRIAFADRHPLITGGMLDAAGNVWLRLDEPLANGRGWLIIDAEGTPRFWHEDRSENALYIGADHMLAITQDELGVQRVVKYRLGR